MKTKLLVGALLLCLWQWAGAQSTSQNSLFGAFQPGFYAGSSIQYGPVADAGAAFVTVQGGVTFGSSWAFGGMYGFSVNEFTPATEADPDVYLDLRMGGLSLEYTWKPDRLLHLSFPLAAGVGEVELDWKDGLPFSAQEPSFGEDNFFFIQPGAMLEVNLASFARLYAGAAYRWVPGGVDYRGLDAADISGPAGVFGIRIGLFR